MIQYNDDLHEYRKSGAVYTSVTQVLEKYKHKFDAATESLAMAERHGQLPGYWKGKWQKETDASLVIGDNLHSLQEELTLSQAFEVREGIPIRVQNQDRISAHIEDYYYWPSGVYTELILWNDEYQLAGRADKVILTTRKYDKVASVDDHKSNKRVRTTSWWDKDTQSYRMMKGPVSHLMDCEYNHYSLQLSMYQFMLECMGFTPGKRRILHYPPLPPDMGYPGERRRRPDIHKVPYLREEVIAILDDHLCQRR